MKEIREYVRHDSLNLVSYILYNENDEIINQGVGRTLNISTGGILLEIEDLVEDEIKTVRMEIALDDNIVSIDGRVAFTLLTTECYTECGIKFNETPQEINSAIQNYIENVLKQKAKKPGLLRVKDARIDNLGLTLSNEHKIIHEYIDAFKKMAEIPENEFTLQNILKLINFLKKDLYEHFYFEEHVVFKAALYDNTIDKKNQALVYKFISDHALMMKEIDEIIAYIHLVCGDTERADDFIVRKIFLFMGLLKKHNREEQELLIPCIDENMENMKYLNSLLI